MALYMGNYGYNYGYNSYRWSYNQLISGFWCHLVEVKHPVEKWWTFPTLFWGMGIPSLKCEQVEKCIFF